MELADRKLFICTVYLPPDRIHDTALINEHTSSVTAVLSETSPSDEVVVIGDSNLPGVMWSASRDGFMYPDSVRSSFPASATSLLNTYSVATLQQMNINENGRMLDLCFVSHTGSAPLISTAPVGETRCPSSSISLGVRRNANYLPTTAAVCYNFYKAGIDGVVAVLSTPKTRLPAF